MSFIDISRALEFSSGGVFKKDFLNGVFVSSGGTFEVPKNFLVVCDEGTKHIALRFVDSPFVISKPNISNVNSVTMALQQMEGVVAVGSGCVFDVCKLASFKAGKPFIGFATALSMNGYLSSSASIVNEEGVKTGYQAHIASSLYFDLDVLKSAPLKLTLAGMGDAIARASAQADGFLAFEAKSQKYQEELFSCRLPSEEFIFTNYKMLEDGDDEFFLQLLENTLFAGIAMYIYGSSVPASGGEHAMAHVFEAANSGFFHGLVVAGFSCEMLKIQNNKFLPKGDYINALNHFGIPSGFADLGLSEAEFEIIKQKAVKYRERYGYLNQLFRDML